MNNIPKNLKHRIDISGAKLPECCVSVSEDIDINVPENVEIFNSRNFSHLCPGGSIRFYYSYWFEYAVTMEKMKQVMDDINLIIDFGKKIKPLVKSVKTVEKTGETCMDYEFTLEILL